MTGALLGVARALGLILAFAAVLPGCVLIPAHRSDPAPSADQHATSPVDPTRLGPPAVIDVPRLTPRDEPACGIGPVREMGAANSTIVSLNAAGKLENGIVRELMCGNETMLVDVEVELNMTGWGVVVREMFAHEATTPKEFLDTAPPDVVNVTRIWWTDPKSVNVTKAQFFATWNNESSYMIVHNTPIIETHLATFVNGTLHDSFPNATAAYEYAPYFDADIEVRHLSASDVGRLASLPDVRVVSLFTTYILDGASPISW